MRYTSSLAKQRLGADVPCGGDAPGICLAGLGGLPFVANHSQLSIRSFIPSGAPCCKLLISWGAICHPASRSHGMRNATDNRSRVLEKRGFGRKHFAGTSGRPALICRDNRRWHCGRTDRPPVRCGQKGAGLLSCLSTMSNQKAALEGTASGL